MHELCGLETAAVQPQRTFEHNGVQHSLVAVFKKLDTVIVEFVETFTVEIYFKKCVDLIPEITSWVEFVAHKPASARTVSGVFARLILSRATPQHPYSRRVRA
jgi:hypothetical protein